MTHRSSSDFVLTLSDVIRVTTISRAQIYRMMAVGSFPRPMMLSKQRIGWRESDIARWIQDLRVNETQRALPASADPIRPAR